MTAIINQTQWEEEFSYNSFIRIRKQIEMNQHEQNCARHGGNNGYKMRDVGAHSVTTFGRWHLFERDGGDLRIMPLVDSTSDGRISIIDG